MILPVLFVCFFSFVWAQSPEQPAEPAAVLPPMEEPADVAGEGDAGDPTLEPQVEPAPVNPDERDGGAAVVAAGTSAPIAVDGTGILVVLTDRDDRVPADGARITLGKGEASALLVDNGEVPDMTAGDSIFTGLLVAPGGGAREIVVETVDGEDIWGDQVQLEAGLESPSLRIDFSEGGEVTAEYRSDEAGVQTPAFQGGGPVPMSGDGLTPQVVNTEPSTGSRVSAAASGSDSWLPVWLALGLILGSFGGAWARLRSRRSPPLTQVGGRPEFAWPVGLNAQQTCHVVSLGQGVGDEAALIAAVNWFSERTTVLVVPGQASRPRLRGEFGGKPGVFWLEEERPAVTQIERALEHLDLVGPTVVVVQSPLALEEPDPDEASDAVIIELGELRAPVCAFVPEDQVVGAVVTCSLQLGEGGYKDQERLLIREGGSGGFHWVEGSD